MTDGPLQDPQEPEDSKPLRYAVRLWPRTTQDIEAAAARLEQLVGEEISQAWLLGLRSEFVKLATNPRSFPVIAEQHLFTQEVRQLVYRRTSASVAHRILFTIKDAGDDGPLVAVIHVRHGAAKPIGRKEARGMEAEN